MDWSSETEFAQINRSVRHSNYLNFPVFSEINVSDKGITSSTGHCFLCSNRLIVDARSNPRLVCGEIENCLLRCTAANKCLNVREQAEMIERN